MSEIDPQEFGRLQAEVQGLRRDTDAQNKLLVQLTQSVDAVNLKLAEASGGWKVMMAIGGAGASIGALVASFFHGARLP